MTALTVREFDFHGDTLLTTMHGGKPVVALRRVVECLGLDWNRQLQRLKADPVLGPNCGLMSTVADDGKVREMAVLPVDMLHGWLFTINPNKVRADLRDKLTRYQCECFAALHAYWNDGAAVRDPDGLSPRVVGGVVKAVTGAMEKRLEAKIEEILTVTLPAMVESAMERDPRYVAVAFVPSIDVLVKHNVPSKGRRGFSNKVSARLRRWCARLGLNYRICAHSGHYLYPVEAVEQWVKAEGLALIRDHIAKLNGQGVLKLVPRQ